MEYMGMFDEFSVVKLVSEEKMKEEVTLQAIACMMGGYKVNHAGDSYRMHDPLTNNKYS